MRKILVSDFTTKEVPHGGSEWVNQVLIEQLGLEFEYSQNVQSFDSNTFYIISNISLMNPSLVRQIPNLNYIIIENDYKICPSRHPWRYPDNIIPLSDRINYDLYSNAKAVFVQTTDHMNVYLKNDVKANFINLECSIWSDSDIKLLNELSEKNKIKNGSENKLLFSIIKETNNRVEFLENLSKCEGLVFYPLARETFCRLVVEAKCMELNVITSKNYGASLEPWFDQLSGKSLISFLETKTKENINKIKDYIL